MTKLIEFHVLQNLSPSCVNRDDKGAPKTAYFGGVVRGRISSQSLKRAVREHADFQQALAGHLGTRTKLFPHLVGERLAKSKGIPKDEHARIVAKCAQIAKADDGGDGENEANDGKVRTPQLIFLGPDHVNEYVTRLERLRKKTPSAYQFYLNPVAGFKETMTAALASADALDDDKDKVVENGWALATVRLPKLKRFAGEEADATPPAMDGDPTPELATWVVERLSLLAQSEERADKDLFKAVLSKPKGDEATQLKAATPEEPPKAESKKFADTLFEPLKTNAIDIALFGRMTTSDAFENVEACMEVAHAISTNAAVREVDYFTAVDDHRSGAAAAHIGENQFNSNCYYKYFSLDWEAFVRQTGGDATLAAKALRAVLGAVVHSMPTGKKKGHANNNRPDAVLVEVKEKNVPTSYANAFVKPVTPGDGDLMSASVKALGHYAGQLARKFEIDADRVWFAVDDQPLFDGLPSVGTLSELTERVLAAVSKGGRVNTVFLRLDGPLQAWGHTSRHVYRETRDAPTLSGVLGLVCAAMGLRRQEATAELVELSKLEMGVRIDRPGLKFTDYHTAGAGVGMMSANGIIKKTGTTGEIETHVMRKEYLADASFLVALRGDEALIRKVADALRAPTWPPFLGRKSCPPSLPVFAGDGDFTNVEQALKSQPWCPRLASETPPKELRALLPAAVGEGVSMADVPVSFAPPRHAHRNVREVPMTVAVGPPLFEDVPRPDGRPATTYRGWSRSNTPAGDVPRREVRLNEDHWLCVFCKEPAREVHHVTYERVGHEPPDDLRSLCRLCHSAVTLMEYAGGFGTLRIDPFDAAWRARILDQRAAILRERAKAPRPARQPRREDD